MLTGSTYQDLTNLPNLYNQRGKIILTGNKDIDYEILLKLDIQDLSKLCRTNKYTQELCDEEEKKSLSLKNYQYIYLESLR